MVINRAQAIMRNLFYMSGATSEIEQRAGHIHTCVSARERNEQKKQLEAITRQICHLQLQVKNLKSKLLV